MQCNTVENRGINQNMHQNVAQITKVPFAVRFALRVLSGLACVALPAAAFAQTTAAPQPLPYYHMIFAGSGTQPQNVTLPTGGGSPQQHGNFPGDKAPAQSAPLYGPVALASDSLGNLYIVDTDLVGSSKGTAVRRVDASGNISTFAGGLAVGVATSKNYLCPSGVDVNGNGCPANETYFNQAYGIAIDPKTGDIYLSEGTGARIRKIDHSSYATTLVVSGSSKSVPAADGAICTSPTCTISTGNVGGPRAIAVDKHGNLYIADPSNYAVRMVNFSTGQLTTVVNSAWAKASAATCTSPSNPASNAGKANTGSIQGITFDSQDNMYFGDTTCDYVYKVAENLTTGMVDAGSPISAVVGTGTSASTCGITSFNTYFKGLGPQDGSAACISPSSVLADPAGNLYIGESTAMRVWFWDAATGYAHTVFGGGAAGSCYGQAGSGTAPFYNGCDGLDSAVDNGNKKGYPGLALDAWGNLYVGDPGNYFVHKIALGTNAPAATTPPGNANVLVHFGANDNFGTIDATAAPDFSVTPGTCTARNADGTVDCGLFVTATGSSTGYESARLTSTTGLKRTIALTNLNAPTCQSPTATDQTVRFNGATTLTLRSKQGAACAGYEAVVASPHSYTYTVVSQPSNGTLSGTAPNLTYTPNPGYNGLDSFTYGVTDNSTFSSNQVTFDGGASTVSLETASPTTSADATMTLQGPPVATPQRVLATPGNTTSITLTGNNPTGGALTYAIASQPANGTLGTISGNAVTYTPSASYAGADSFTFTVSDGVLASAAATVTISDHPGVPTAQNQTVSLTGPTPVSIALTSTGAASGSVTYAVASSPAFGSLSGVAPNLTYTPTSIPPQDDSFTFYAATADGSTNGTITIKAPLVAPVAQDQSVSIAIGAATHITLSATGKGTISYSLVSTPQNGQCTLSGSVVTYTPAPGFVGQDSFTFKASNGVDSNLATVSISIGAPSATPLSVTTSFSASTSVILSAIGTGPLTYQVVTNPANGTLSGSAPNLTYTPNSGFAGSDSFTYTAANAGGPSNVATVTVSVSQGLIWTAASGGSLNATVKAGSTATYSLQVSAWKGANTAVNFVCSGAAVACTVAPGTATLNGTTPVPVKVTITTTTMPPSTAGFGAGKPGWWLLLSVGGGLLLLPLRKRRSLLLCVACLLAIAGAVGCSGVPEHPFGTTAGSYSMSVQAYSNGAPVGQPVAITLNVQ
jgi:hypothetical protein